jgi:uncharacterized protein (TIGR02271 family)
VPTITAAFRDPGQASTAVAQLRGAGINKKAISLEETGGALLDALLPGDQRSQQSRVTVRVDEDNADNARRILGESGAVDIEDDRGAPASAESNTLPLAEEELHPIKTLVQVGVVTVRKVVVTEMRTIEVPVRREEVVVERSILTEPRPVINGSGDGMATQLGGEEEVVRIPILEEQVTIEKHPVVREEIRVLKRRIDETVRLQTAVRREEPVLTQTDSVGAPSNGQSTAPSTTARSKRRSRSSAER